MSKNLAYHERSRIILGNRKLTSTETLVMLAISHHMIDKDCCWPSQETLSNLTGLIRQTVNRIIRGLIAKGVLKHLDRFERSKEYEARLRQLSEGVETKQPMATL
jgi:hypothetical protein